MAPPRHGRYTVEPVTFQSEGVEMVGNLYLPQGGDVSKAPGIALLGPFCFVKEQAPIQYATRLADEGFVALAFDCRTHGASKGEPRRLEEPQNKVVDLGNAIEYLKSRPEVDADKVAALGVCEGASEVLVAAASNPNIKAAAIISGHYREHDNDVALIGGLELLGGEITKDEAEARLQLRSEKAKAALEKYKATGEVEYIPIVDPLRKDVGLPWKPIWDWYHGWADRGIWENRVALMSYVRYMDFESLNAGAAKMKVPVVMIHGEFSDGPPSAYKHFEAITSEKKKLIKEDGVNHFQYYEDPVVIDRAVGNAAAFLLEHLEA